MDAHDRSDIDDAAIAAAHHALHGRAGQAEGGREVDGDHRVPFLVLHAHEEVVAGHAGIVDQDVEPSMAASAAGTRASTESLSDRFASTTWTRSPRRRCEFVQRRAARSREGDGRALGVERAGDGAADAAGRAGDESLAAGEIEHVAFLVLMPWRQRALKAATSSGVPIAVPVAPGAMRFTRPVRTLPDPDLIERINALGRHEGHAFAPADRAGHLADEPVADRIRIGHRARLHVGDDRHGRRLDGDAGQRLAHGVGRRLP